LVSNLSDLGSPSFSAADTSPNENVTQLPVVEKEEINFSAKDGPGSFGVVYKEAWTGTKVAVTHGKIRNPRRLRSVMETEVRIYSMLRHPNIDQLWQFHS